MKCAIGIRPVSYTHLLRLLAGELHSDGGDIWRQPGLRVATLAQELPADTTATVFEIVAGGLEGLGALLAEYHEAAIQLAHVSTPEAMRKMERLQHDLEARDGWRWQQRVETVISRLQPVSYTHLDVYKRQFSRCWWIRPCRTASPSQATSIPPKSRTRRKAARWYCCGIGGGGCRRPDRFRGILRLLL